VQAGVVSDALTLSRLEAAMELYALLDYILISGLGALCAATSNYE
jgi:hypothetical protein